jgi:3-dehydroquinate synthase/2-deoxy-scyllo-inosose synthase
VAAGTEFWSGAMRHPAFREDVISLEIRFGNTRVPVLLGTGARFEDTATDAIRALAADRVFVVVDAVVARLYPDDLRRFAALGASPGVVFVAPEGERCKTLPVLGDVTDACLGGGATKRSLVLGFGGGATMNLSGLAAALIYRGLRLCYVPTTLMAQNDVVPSMKTAINFCERKNNFGAFHASSLNVVDTRYLHTLPATELRAGMGELVKNALVLGGEHFTMAERMLDAHAQGALDDVLFAQIVEAGIRAKLPALAVDAEEARAGMIFEYGHTVGHALERCYPVGVLPHGLAVCWGMRSCAYVASQLGLMAASERARHDALIQRLVPEGLPTPLPTVADVMFRVMRDGKRGRAGESADECSCVLLSAIGEAHQAETMLSRFPATLIGDWLRAQGLNG